jgi:signal transduction histidine kinase
MPLKIPVTRVPLRLILVSLCFTALMMPFFAIWLLKIFQSELIRQTEGELIAQGVIIGEFVTGKLEGESEHQRGQTLPRVLEPIMPSIDLLDSEIFPPAEEDPLLPITPEPKMLNASSQMNKVLSQISRKVLAGIRITDINGTVVASTSEGGLYRSLAGRQEFKAAANGQVISLLRKRSWSDDRPALDSFSRSSDMRVFVAIPIKTSNEVVGAVILSRTAMSLDKVLYRYMDKITLVIFGYLIVLILMVILAERAIASPIASILAFVESKVGDGKRKLTTNHVAVEAKELAALKTSVERLSNTLSLRGEYIRNFVRHVSHEFKSPLSGIFGTIEVLKRDKEKMTNLQLEKFLSNVISDCTRMTSLIDGMNQLARFDTGFVQESTHEISIESIAAYLGKWPDARLASVDMKSFRSCFSFEYLCLVFDQLINNSFEHGATRVDVKLTSLENQRKVSQEVVIHIQITDDGEGISSDNIVKVFQPFFTTKRSRGGTGLGLSMVKAAVEMHGASIYIESPYHGQIRGTLFTIALQ